MDEAASIAEAISPDEKSGAQASARALTSLTADAQILKFLPTAFRNAIRHHVKIAFGLDWDPELIDGEFVALVQEGLKPVEALQAATVNAAELLGLSDRIGSIEAGKYADVMAVKGDPLAEIKNMENVIFVMKGGDVVKNVL